MDVLLDRQYLSQYKPDHVGIQIVTADGLTDVDGNNVTAMLTMTDTNEVVFTGRDLDHEETGTYGMDLSSSDVRFAGPAVIVYEYSINGAPDSSTVALEIGPPAPAYDILNEDVKGVVEQVVARLADLYDSPYGGPHLQVYIQTHFGRQRVAQLLTLGLGVLNTTSQPYSSFSVAPGGKAFPVAQWGALLEKATFIEVLKHLRRSYVEQPSPEGVGVARLDRRDYLSRWGEILNDEREDFKPMLETFKMSQMGLGHVSVLVAGGAYGMAGAFAPLSMPARPRYWARWYS